MRTSKIAAIVAAAALLVLGAAFTSMAATGWQEENGTWVYYDKNEELVTEDWRKSGNNWYWLDEDGYMATDRLIEDDNGHKYYVDGNGVMVRNIWELLDNEDEDDKFEDQIWYYFQASGKAYQAADGKGITWKSINGKKYGFDEDARMVYGWIAGEDDNYEMLGHDEDEDTAYMTGMYYCGDNMDGHRRENEWERLWVEDEENKTDENWWFRFGANGKKITGTTKKINGYNYAFDDYGVMRSEWVPTNKLASWSTATLSQAHMTDKFMYFSDPENGAKFTKGWFIVVPSKNIEGSKNDYEDDTERWYYAKGNGELYKSTLKSINGKKYAFNEDGVMIAGLAKGVYNDGDWEWTKITKESVMNEYTDIATWADGGDGFTPSGKTGIYFFGPEIPDGSMKTGNVTATVDGEEYKMKFKANGEGKGTGIMGKDGNNYYLNGLKITADSDNKYELFEVKDAKADENIKGDWKIVASGKSASSIYAKGTPVDKVVTVSGKYLLISSSGAVIKSGSKTDADDYKITVDKSTGLVKTIEKKDK